jgi:hypothetical protein
VRNALVAKRLLQWRLLTPPSLNQGLRIAFHMMAHGHRQIPRRFWKGTKFSGLLILGEAHYGLSPKDDDAEATVKLIERTIAGWKFGFYTKVAQVVTGQLAPNINRAEFWPTVAFHNFVQSSVGKAGERPTREQWDLGHELLPAVIQELRPTHILVLGKDSMKNLPPFDGPAPLPIVAPDRTTQADQVGVYRTGAGSFALAMEINHPSSRGFSPPSWHPLVRAFLATGIDTQ